MPKIVYPICCGIDVHKSFVVACIATTDAKLVTTYKSKRFSTFTGELRRLAEWLGQNQCYDVCMESTGKYWIPVWNILEPTCKLVLAHPKYVKAIKGKKPTSAMLNGLPISSSTTLSTGALFLLPTSGSFAIWFGIISN